MYITYESKSLLFSTKSSQSISPSISSMKTSTSDEDTQEMSYIHRIVIDASRLGSPSAKESSIIELFCGK